MHGPRAISQHLHFDVARAFDDLFHVKATVAKGRLGLGACLRDQALELFHVMRDADATAPAPCGSFDHHRKADRQSHGAGLIRVVDAPVRSRHHRHTCRFGGDAGGNLVAHNTDAVALGSDPDHPRCFHRIGEIGVFGKKAVARMHRIGLGQPRRFKDRFDLQIRLRGRRRANRHGLIRQLHGQTVGIG